MAQKTPLFIAVLFASIPVMAAGDPDIEPITCGPCAAWNQPQQPFKLAANTWYVGTAELSALLITGPKGHILLDGALPQSAPLIAQNIQSLGFKLKDVKLILNSHAHWDHAGGIAWLQKRTGAKVVTSPHGAQVLRDGAIGTDDPQYDPGNRDAFPKVANATGAADGETLSVGPLKVTAHHTPGHTPGGTTWTWNACEKGRCLDFVYADSLTPVSADGFRYTGARAEELARSIDKVAALKCDVVVSTHPQFTDILKKLQARTPANNTFITPDGCRNYALDARQRLQQRLEREAKGGLAAAPHPH